MKNQKKNFYLFVIVFLLTMYFFAFEVEAQTEVKRNMNYYRLSAPRPIIPHDPLVAPCAECVPSANPKQNKTPKKKKNIALRKEKENSLQSKKNENSK